MQSIDSILPHSSIENRLYQIAAQERTTLTEDDRRVILEAVAELDRFRELVRQHLEAAQASASIKVSDPHPGQRIPLEIGPRFGVMTHIRASIIRDSPALARELISETVANHFLRAVSALGKDGLEPYLEAERKAEADAELREQEAKNASPG